METENVAVIIERPIEAFPVVIGGYGSPWIDKERTREDYW